MELSQDERQKFLELIDKVSPCAAISEKKILKSLKSGWIVIAQKELHLLKLQKYLKIRLEMTKCFLYQQMTKL